MSLTDQIDTCVFCGQEVPPGPAFCSAKCEKKAGVVKIKPGSMAAKLFPGKKYFTILFDRSQK